MKMFRVICLCICSMVIGAMGGIACVKNEFTEEIKNEKYLEEKHLVLFQLMTRWVKNQHADKSIDQYLQEQGIATIAIYGMNYVGKTLLEELTNSPIEVKYAIDNNKTLNDIGIPIVLAEDQLEPVDAVIVTAITYFADIKELLGSKVDSKIISLEEIIYDM